MGAERLDHALVLGSFTDGGGQFCLDLLLAVEDQCFLAREVREEGRRRYVGSFGDVADTRLFEAVFQEEVQRSVGDGLPRRRLLAFATANGRRVGHGVTVPHNWNEAETETVALMDSFLLSWSP